MKSIVLGQRVKSILILVLLLAVAPVLFATKSAALGMNNRSVRIGSSSPSATTQYVFNFDITLPTVLGSIRFEFCENSPIIGEVCTVPAGFDISSATLTGQIGETGFTIDPGVTPNTLVLSRGPAPATPQPVQYIFDAVINPSTPNTTNYIRVTTHGTTDGTGPSIEDGGLAYSINDDFSITLFVPPFLQFCVGISIASNDCLTATGNLIDLGILSETTPNTAVSQFTGATNGVGGLAISVIGTTMTSGINTIPALAAPSPSIPGTGQFGINVRANTVPTVGLNPTGPGTTLPVGDYNIPNQFTFRDGDIIAQSALSTNFSTFTVTYLVNVGPTQPPGVYTSTLTYVATASF
jgi:hypothetical protein